MCKRADDVSSNRCDDEATEKEQHQKRKELESQTYVKRMTGPDCGWSWVIAIACAFLNFFTLALIRTGSVIFLNTIEYYDTSRAAASWPPSLISAVSNLSGIVTGYITQRFGPRRVALIGSLISSGSIIACFFATDITRLTIFCGVCHAIGIGLTVPGVAVCLNQWFRERKVTASGIIYTGAALGSFVYPVFFEWLIDYFSFRGGFLLLGAVMAHSFAAALVIRSPPWLAAAATASSRRQSRQSSRRPSAAPQEQVGNRAEKPVQENQATADANPTTSPSSEDSTNPCTTTTTTTAAVPFAAAPNRRFVVRSVSETSFDSVESRPEDAVQQQQQQQQQQLHQQQQQQQQLRHRLPHQHHHHNLLHHQIRHQFPGHTVEPVAEEVDDPTDPAAGAVTVTTDASALADSVHAAGVESANVAHSGGGGDDDKEHVQGDKAKPSLTAPGQADDETTQVQLHIDEHEDLECCNQHDDRCPAVDLRQAGVLRVLASGANISVSNTAGSTAAASTSPGVSAARMSIHSGHRTRLRRSASAISTTISLYSPAVAVQEIAEQDFEVNDEVVDETPLRMSPIMVLVGISYVCMINCNSAFQIILLDFAGDRGVEVHEGVYLLSGFALFDIAGRLSVGQVSDRGLMTRPALIGCAGLLFGVAMNLLTFANGFPQLLFLAALIGFALGTSMVLTTVLVGDYVGDLSRISLSIGWMSFAAGVTGLSRPFIIGFFRDTIGDYGGMLHLMGCLMLCTGVAWIAVNVYEKRSIARLATESGKSAPGLAEASLPAAVSASAAVGSVPPTAKTPTAPTVHIQKDPAQSNSNSTNCNNKPNSSIENRDHSSNNSVIANGRNANATNNSNGNRNAVTGSGGGVDSANKNNYNENNNNNNNSNNNNNNNASNPSSTDVGSEVINVRL